MPWNLISSFTADVGAKIDTGVTYNTGQWVAVVNQDWLVDQVEQWGVIQGTPALPTLFGGRPVLDQKLCFNLVEVIYGSVGIGTGGRIVLYIKNMSGRLTVPISIYRWS